jgi:hypothetical protein
MIDALMAAHPRGMDRANLADRVGMTATSGTFQTYLSRLKSNGVIEVGRPQNYAHGGFSSGTMPIRIRQLRSSSRPGAGSANSHSI